MIRKSLFVLVVVVIITAIGVWLFLRSFLPEYKTDITAAALKEPVTVERNRFAVPTISAQNDDDLYFAWGYVNAQDRIFQMEFTRRVAQGRLSEFAGESTVSKDYFLKAVGFYERAKSEFKKMTSENRRFLTRYVEGINYYLDTQGTPLYMKLLGIEREKWQPADAFSVAMMLNWSLAYNMKHELIYHGILKKIGRERAAELLNLVPPETPTIIDDRVGHYLNEDVFGAFLDSFDDMLGCFSASNNWAIAPIKTAYQGAILSTDMQVHNSKLPNDFYLVHVKSPDYKAAGAQVVGLPFIVSGYTRHFAWGLTNNGADTVDLFAETINWDNETYHYQGKDYPLAKKEIEIKVKDQDPVRKTVYKVEHKPVLNDVFPELGFDVSLDWTGFDDINVEGFFFMNRASNKEAFLQGARMIRMSPQNMVYADADGNIGYRVIGSLPKRIEGTGNFIQTGEMRQRNWQGILPDAEYPAVENPERGFIASANNKPAQATAYQVNGTYAPGYRYENIVRLLRDKTGIDTDYVEQMQTDTFSMLAAKVQRLMLRHVQPGNEVEEKALKAVLSWDGVNRKDAVGPGIYNTFYVRLAYQILEDDIGSDLAARYIVSRYISQERIFQILSEQSDWIDDVSTTEVENLTDIANRAFSETVRMLKTYFDSADINDWHWGELHKIKFNHVLGQSDLMKPLVNYGPFPFEGDSETNNRARFYEIEPPFIADLASAPRIVVSFDPEPSARMMLITGENEYFISKHNTDMTDAWLRHEFFSLEKEPTVYRMDILPE